MDNKKKESEVAKRKFGSRVGGPVFFRSWGANKKGEGGWDVDDCVSGTIVDHSLDKKYKRTNYHLKVEEFNFECENQNGEPMKVGDVLVLNGTGGLKKHLGCLKEDTAVKKGTALQVTYEGEAEITGGEWEGEKAHSIAVQFEDDYENGSVEASEDMADDL